MKNKSLLITGCAGFIGSHACVEYHNMGYSVFGIDSMTYASKKENINMISVATRCNWNYYFGDICDTDLVSSIVDSNNIDWIINFAAETHVDNSIKSVNSFIHSNISGVASLLDICKVKKNVKLLHVSTDEVYGSSDNGEIFNESSNLNPRNPYSATKAASEHLIKSYSNTHDVKYIIVRPTNNFGSNQHAEKFIPTIVRSLMKGKKIPIYGDGKNYRDWLYVKDNVFAIEHIMRNSSINECYNISGKNEMTNIEIVKKICDILNFNFEKSIMFIEDRPGHDKRYAICDKKLENLGYNKRSDFMESLIQTIMEIK